MAKIKNQNQKNVEYGKLSNKISKICGQIIKDYNSSGTFLLRVLSVSDFMIKN